MQISPLWNFKAKIINSHWYTTMIFFKFFNTLVFIVSTFWFTIHILNVTNLWQEKIQNNSPIISYYFHYPHFQTIPHNFKHFPSVFFIQYVQHFQGQRSGETQLNKMCRSLSISKNMTKMSAPVLRIYNSICRLWAIVKKNHDSKILPPMFFNVVIKFSFHKPNSLTAVSIFLFPSFFLQMWVCDFSFGSLSHSITLAH